MGYRFTSVEVYVLFVFDETYTSTEVNMWISIQQMTSSLRTLDIVILVTHGCQDPVNPVKYRDFDMAGLDLTNVRDFATSDGNSLFLQ